MTSKKKDQPNSVNTGGGAYIAGRVDTGGGDFVGRDKITPAGQLTQNIFAPVYQAIEKSKHPAAQKADLKADVEEIQGEVVKAEQADESFLARRLRALKSMAPEIAEVALSALAGPGAMVAAIIKNVAKKVKDEG